MGSALVVAVVKYGLLALLWIFVLLVVRTVRADFASRSGPPSVPVATPGRAGKAPKPVKAPRTKGTPRTLVVTEGALQGTTVTLGTGAVTLGRAQDSTVVLTDDYASTKHARLVPGEDGWHVEDLGSTNGTYLAGAKVTRPTLVKVGVPIRIGKTVLELRT